MTPSAFRGTGAKQTTVSVVTSVGSLGGEIRTKHGVTSMGVHTRLSVGLVWNYAGFGRARRAPSRLPATDDPCNEHCTGGETPGFGPGDPCERAPAPARGPPAAAWPARDRFPPFFGRVRRRSVLHARSVRTRLRGRSRLDRTAGFGPLGRVRGTARTFQGDAGICGISIFVGTNVDRVSDYDSGLLTQRVDVLEHRHERLTPVGSWAAPVVDARRSGQKVHVVARNVNEHGIAHRAVEVRRANGRRLVGDRAPIVKYVVGESRCRHRRVKDERARA